MNRRFIRVLLALSISSTLAACGSDQGADAQPTLELSGVYRPVDHGSIGSITFSDRKNYLLMPSGCGGAACADIGTYRIDTSNSTLVLENAATHQTRSIALENVKTTNATASLVKSIAPRDLLEPGQQLTRNGQQTTNGGQQVTSGSSGQQLATGGGQVTGAVSQLLQIIQQAIMNGQQMQRDDQNNNANPAPKVDPKDCKQGVPTKDTAPADALAYFARCPGGP